MSKKQNRIKGIIDGFFRDKFSEEYRKRMQGTFEDWIINPIDEKEKDKELTNVWHEIWTDGGKEHITLSGSEPLEKEKAKSGKEVQKSIPLHRRVMRVAAVIVPLLMVVGTWWFYSNKDAQVPLFAQNFSVINGEKEDIILPDSTSIKINSGTTLSVVLDKEHRIAELSGESYFNVTKDAQRPFVVKTQDVMVTALGTAFNVEAYPGSNVVIVTLMEGSVSLASGDDAEWTLKPNQMFVYDKAKRSGEIQDLTAAQTEDMAAWTEGRAVCNFRSLNDIFKIVERWFAVEVEVESGVDLSGREYMISIEPGDTPDMAIGALAAMTDKFGYRIEGEKIFITPIQ